MQRKTVAKKLTARTLAALLALAMLLSLVPMTVFAEGDDPAQTSGVEDQIVPEEGTDLPPADTEEPAVETEEPAVDTEEPAVETEEPVVDTEEPVVDAEEPVVTPEEPAEEAPEATLQGEIVDYKTLADVTGIGYDAKAKSLYWNNVPHASYYELTFTDTATQTVLYTSTVYSDLSYDVSLADGSYSVTIKPAMESWEAHYLAAANVPVADIGTKYIYGTDYNRSLAVDAERTLYNLYNTPQGKDSAPFAFSTTSPKASDTTITALSGIALKELYSGNLYFELVNPPALQEDEEIHWEISNNPEFSDKEDYEYLATRTTYDSTSTVSVALSQFTPGLETCYVRARVLNPNFIVTTPDGTQYGAYAPTFTYAIPAAEVTGFTTYITGNSITLEPGLNIGGATGYQYARKAGSKWVTLNTSNSPAFTDTGLAANTKYQYRARAYFYNTRTGATNWTAWKTVSVTTWGGTLNLKADVASSTSIKLSWSKVDGAEGYEVYRYNQGSSWDVSENGQNFNSFSNYTLIKTITKGSTKTYTDKKLTKGDSYTYIVRAYRTLNKQKCYIQGSAYASLQASSLSVTQQYYTSTGSYKVVWQKMTGLKGYKVEKQNPVTRVYEPYSTLKGNATTITFPRVEAGTESVRYRIRPYTDAKTYSDGGYTFSVQPALGVVQGVKAQATSEGVQVSWNAVPGADYYSVYRTTNGHADYNKTTKAYAYSGGSSVAEAAVNTDNINTAIDGGTFNSVGSYTKYDIEATSVIDRKVTYLKRSRDDDDKLIEVGKTEDGKTIYQTEEVVYYKGPELGVTYHYYVVAHANQPNGKAGVGSISSIGHSKAATATYTKVTLPKKSSMSSAKSTKKGQVTLKYKKVAGAKGYGIYRSTSKNGTYTLVGNTNKTTFTDTDVPSGKTYYYKVAPYVVGEAQANIYAELSTYKKVKVK